MFFPFSFFTSNSAPFPIESPNRKKKPTDSGRGETAESSRNKPKIRAGSSSSGSFSPTPLAHTPPHRPHKEQRDGMGSSEEEQSREVVQGAGPGKWIPALNSMVAASSVFSDFFLHPRLKLLAEAQKGGHSIGMRLSSSEEEQRREAGEGGAQGAAQGAGKVSRRTTPLSTPPLRCAIPFAQSFNSGLLDTVKKIPPIITVVCPSHGYKWP